MTAFAKNPVGYCMVNPVGCLVGAEAVGYGATGTPQAVTAVPHVPTNTGAVLSDVKAVAASEKSVLQATDEISASIKPLILPAPQPGSVVKNAMSELETAQAQDIVNFKGGKFIGQPESNTPGIDGWLDGVPVSLKEVTGKGMTAVQRNIVNGTKQMVNSNQIGDMYVDAVKSGVSLQDVAGWIKPGTPISNILNEGSVNNIIIKTTNGWITLTRTTIAKPR